MNKRQSRKQQKKAFYPPKAPKRPTSQDPRGMAKYKKETEKYLDWMEEVAKGMNHKFPPKIITSGNWPDEDSWIKKMYLNNSITEWENIYDKDGDPLPVTTENKAQVISDVESVVNKKENKSWLNMYHREKNLY